MHKDAATGKEIAHMILDGCFDAGLIIADSLVRVPPVGEMRRVLRIYLSEKHVTTIRAAILRSKYVNDDPIVQPVATFEFCVAHYYYRSSRSAIERLTFDHSLD